MFNKISTQTSSLWDLNSALYLRAFIGLFFFHFTCSLRSIFKYFLTMVFFYCCGNQRVLKRNSFLKFSAGGCKKYSGFIKKSWVWSKNVTRNKWNDKSKQKMLIDRIESGHEREGEKMKQIWWFERRQNLTFERKLSLCLLKRFR